MNTFILIINILVIVMNAVLSFCNYKLEKYDMAIGYACVGSMVFGGLVTGLILTS